MTTLAKQAPRKALVTIALAGLALVAIGCGGSGGGTTTSTPQVSKQQAQSKFTWTLDHLVSTQKDGTAIVGLSSDGAGVGPASGAHCQPQGGTWDCAAYTPNGYYSGTYDASNDSFKVSK